jgi:hypothetical protein
VQKAADEESQGLISGVAERSWFEEIKVTWALAWPIYGTFLLQVGPAIGMHEYSRATEPSVAHLLPDLQEMNPMRATCSERHVLGSSGETRPCRRYTGHNVHPN